jgi:glycosyltransferase involved in cell wall biosynthesis
MCDRTNSLVSIVVCTRNRADALSKTLRAISRLVVPPGIAVELLVVDNGSTDDTQSVWKIAISYFRQ